MSGANKSVKVSVLLGILLAVYAAAAQDASNPLLRLQLSKAYLDIDSHVQHGQGLNGVTYGNPGDVWNYPNSLACLVVYGNGGYVLEKTDEPTLGKPKTKRSEGTLGADDLQLLRGILDADPLKAVSTPKVKDLPDDTVALREVESLDAQIDHAGTEQHFTMVKQRVKTTATSGMDTYVDNGAPYQKTLTPLVKWFEGFQKKNKSEMKEAKPQVCMPMNVG